MGPPPPRPTTDIVSGLDPLIKSESDEVHGIVYKISDSDERTLDIKESVKSGAYRKEMLSVDVNAQSLKCLIYVDPVEKEGAPKQEYIERVNKGILDAALPSEYIERYVRKFIPA